MRFSLKATRLGLRNSITRIPFRYGNTCLTRCPQAVLEATIEVCDASAASRTQTGYSGDCLPPGWFDKTTGRSFRQQIDEMLAAIALAESAFLELGRKPTMFFPLWLEAYRRVQDEARQNGMNPLLASFGVSFLERAIIDALARAAGLSFARLVRQNLLAIDAGAVHPELAGLHPADWLPAEPSCEVFVRHTVGLSDPLTVAEIKAEDRVDDGFPQAVEEYIERTGTRYFKLKLSNQPERDRDRLVALASLAQRHYGDDYRVTLDGNEQYKQPEDFAALVELLLGTPALATLWQNTLAIEQPLDRKIALDADATRGVRELGRHKPVIIDESDATLESYSQALELGYRGVSSKNCKGPIKSLLNAGLTWLRNGHGGSRGIGFQSVDDGSSRRHSGSLSHKDSSDRYLMTGEDLCSVGIIPTQADLCLAATLGLTHVERNGHHYHPGLSYLPSSQRQAALAAHGDFYARINGVVTPCVRDGKFQLGSLQCVGFGFAVLPDFDALVPASEWRYESLGLPE
jgi:L-alanine-DL-glutamate epimerase-like enolase superfamily enzyme